MFKLNNKLEVKKQYLKNSIIYTIDDFYKKPDEILSFIERNPSHPHKIEEEGSLNMKYFQDLRHSYNFKDMENVENYLKKITNQKIKYQNFNFLTNVTKFMDRDFNDYKNKRLDI